MSTAVASACGILLVDKPSGATSHDVVQWARWGLRVRAVGHFGTLDPAATGLLVLGVGPVTRLGPYLTGLDKTYRASIVLGRSTSTADAEGETLECVPCPPGTAELAVDAARGLVGEWSLPPPVVSAVKVDGVRAHARVRRGETVELALRPMAVHRAEDVRAAHHENTVVVDAVLHVSKGTYVRSLAVELGRRLGLPAHLGALRRLRVGTLAVDDPAIVGELEAERAPEGPHRARVVWPGAGDDRRAATEARLHAALLPATTGLPMPVVQLRKGPATDVLLRRLVQGQAPQASDEVLASALPATPGLVALSLDASSALILVEAGPGNVLRPRRVVIAPNAALDKASLPDNPPAKP